MKTQLLNRHKKKKRLLNPSWDKFDQTRGKSALPVERYYVANVKLSKGKKKKLWTINANHKNQTSGLKSGQNHLLYIFIQVSLAYPILHVL